MRGFERLTRDQVRTARWDLRSCTPWLLLGTVVLSTALLVARLHQGFNPSDDPVQAHAAERVLHGDRPHVEFHETYTGGLSYLNAFALRLFGIRLESPRIMLLLFFIVWVPVFWWIALRLTAPWTASLITLLAVVWSVPQYPSPLPSWYNLYFATFGTAALFRYIDNRRARWSFLAGLFAGLSFLAKISGLYFLAAVGLFLIYDEQNLQDGVRVRDRNITGSAFSAALTLALIAFDGVLLRLLHTRADLAEFYHFALPGFALSFFLIAREWQKPRFEMAIRRWQLGSRFLPMLAGFVLPVVVFLVPYLRSGTLGKWYTGVFVLPVARLQNTFYPAIHPLAAITCIPLFLAIAAATRMKTATLQRIGLAVASFACLVSIFLCLRIPAYARWTWVSVATSIPILALVSVALLLRRKEPGGKRDSQLVLLVAVAALCSLVQFPFSGPFYFCYVSPLLVLALLALAIVYSKGQSLLPLVPVPIFYLAFVGLLILPSQISGRGLSLMPLEQKKFSVPRAAGMYGDAATVDAYERALAEVSKHQGVAPIYAGPDAAGLYFLTGSRNPTPILWEFLAGSDRAPNRILTWIEQAGVRVVVVNQKSPSDSGPLDAELLEALRNRFPQAVQVGFFEIRWKDSGR